MVRRLFVCLVVAGVAGGGCMNAPERPNKPSGGGNGGAGGMDEPIETVKKDAAATTKRLDAQERQTDDPSPPADSGAPSPDVAASKADVKLAGGDSGGGGGGDGGGGAAPTFTELWMAIFGVPMGQPQSCAGTNCHNPGKKDMVDFSSQVTAYTSLTRANGPVVKGNPTGSKLYMRLTSTDPARRMPLGKPALSKELIEKVRAWIAAGAPND